MSTANNHEPHAHQAPQHFKGAELPFVNRSKSKIHGMASNLLFYLIVEASATSTFCDIIMAHVGDLPNLRFLVKMVEPVLKRSLLEIHYIECFI